MLHERWILVLSVVLSTAAVGCDDNGDGTGGTGGGLGNPLNKVIVEREDLSIFEAALEETDLDETLANTSERFTLFAPSDDAFERLFAALGGDESEYDQDGDGDFDREDLLELDNLRDIVSYHLIVGERLSRNQLLTTAPRSLTTYESSALQVSTRDDRIFLDGGTSVVQSESSATNGVVHVIDSVLFAPGDFPGNVMERLAIAPGFDELVGAVQRANLVESWALLPEVTIFVPTNQAFSALDNELVDAELNDTLLYHTAPANLSGEEVGNRATLRTMLNDSGAAGAPLVITKDGESVHLGNGTELIATDLTAQNGRIHVIDNVLTVPGDLVDVLQELSDADDGPSFTVLAEALDAAGLTPTLQDELGGESGALQTLFAPSDRAFELLLSALDVDDLQELNDALDAGALEQVLRYHIIPGLLDASEVVTEETQTTLVNDASFDPALNVGQSGEVIVLDGRVRVVTSNIPARNGVIHVVDAVLYPTDAEGRDFPGTTDAMLEASPRFRALLNAVDEADDEVEDALSGPGALTLFAPTNAAFEQVSDLEALLEDSSTLTNVLLYHVFGEEVLAGSLTSGSTETLLGVAGDPATFDATLNHTVDGETITLASPQDTSTATVIYTDIVTDNGVVHVIDALLMPETL